MSFGGVLKEFAIRRMPRTYLVWRRLHHASGSEQELDLLPKLLPPGAIVVDVGANEGLYTRRLSSIGAKVIAFEPIPEMAKALRSVSSANVEVRQLALSREVGLAQLSVPRVAGRRQFSRASLSAGALEGDDAVQISVPISTLDIELATPAPERDESRLDLIKIDVEGHELNVLEGAVKVIEMFRPIFLVESEARHCPGAPFSVFEFFKSRGYSGYYIIDHEITSIDFFKLEMQDPSVLTSSGARIQGRHYVNNFFFMPDERGVHALRAAAAASPRA